MFPLSVLRRIRPSACPQMQVASRLVCWSGLHDRQHAVRRSFIRLAAEVQPGTVPLPGPSVRRFCTSAANASDPGNLIYSGTLGKAILGVKMFSYTSSGVSLCLMPHILLQTGLASQGLAMQACFCGVIGFFTFFTPVLLHLVTRGYVVRLYHRADTDAYTAVTVGALLREKRTVFGQAQVRVPAVGGMFTSFYVGGRGLLVNPELFRLPCDYNHLMGYDRPFSFPPDHLEKPDKG